MPTACTALMYSSCNSAQFQWDYIWRKFYTTPRIIHSKLLGLLVTFWSVKAYQIPSFSSTRTCSCLKSNPPPTSYALPAVWWLFAGSYVVSCFHRISSMMIGESYVCPEAVARGLFVLSILDHTFSLPKPLIFCSMNVLIRSKHGCLGSTTWSLLNFLRLNLPLQGCQSLCWLLAKVGPRCLAIGLW